MQLYRFSPIRTKDDLLKTIEYVASATSDLVEKTLGKGLPIAYVTIFSHYPDEFENLKQWALELGVEDGCNNGLRVRLHEPIATENGVIEYIRIRKPDPYRMQVGCADFLVEDYESFKKDELPKHSENIRAIMRPEYQMLEFFDPDTDVLAYIVSN